MNYDLLIIGGGIAGATLAKRLAEQGLRILVLEREIYFRDRVRGEGLHPWGVAEAQRLGIYELLCNSCGHAVPWWNSYGGSREPAHRRDLVTTSRHGLPVLSFYHPEMQEVLLGAARAAGAEVWRGASALQVIPGPTPQVNVRYSGKLFMPQAHLVVSAVGRASPLQLPPSFRRHWDTPQLTIAGLLFRDLAAPHNAVSLFATGRRPGQWAIFFPLGKRRHRVYFIYPTICRPQTLSGHHQIPLFMSACCDVGVPMEWFVAAVPAGPLAAYPAAAGWVDLPYQQGVALIGDAAGSPNPSFGCGLSLTLRDVRVLSEQLLTTSNWDVALRTYAHTHVDYFDRLHRKENWLTNLFFSQGASANRRRAYVMGLHAKEPDRDLDIVGLGPDDRYDEWARMRFFGEDTEAAGEAMRNKA